MGFVRTRLSPEVRETLRFLAVEAGTAERTVIEEAVEEFASQGNGGKSEVIRAYTSHLERTEEFLHPLTVRVKAEWADFIHQESVKRKVKKQILWGAALYRLKDSLEEG